MGRWMFSVCIMVVEAWGNVYFFDTFLGRKKGIFSADTDFRHIWP